MAVESYPGQIGSEAEEFIAARKRAQKELSKVKKIVNNLLDNITLANREFVDQRLRELKQQKQQLQARLEELDRLVGLVYNFNKREKQYLLKIAYPFLFPLA